MADRFQLVDLGDDVDRQHGAFMDTAAIIQNLDLVITSDTSMAHVAGRWEQRYGWRFLLLPSGAGSGRERRAPGIPACGCFARSRPAIGRACWRGWLQNWTNCCLPHDAAVVAAPSATYDPQSRSTKPGSLTL